MLRNSTTTIREKAIISGHIFSSQKFVELKKKNFKRTNEKRVIFG